MTSGDQAARTELNGVDRDAEAIPDYETYDYSTVWAHRGIEDKAERELIGRLAAASERQESALDLGGGFGRITKELEPYFQRVCMLDYSQLNLRRASHRLSKTEVVRGSVETLPFEDDSFDFVTMVRVMQHVVEPDRVLREITRVGRDGGTFVLGIANEKLTGYRKIGGHSLAWITPQGHRVYVTPLSRYDTPSLHRSEVFGAGLFDNRLGRRLEGTPLSKIDVATARLWPMKSLLFVKYTINKQPGGAGDPRGD